MRRGFCDGGNCFPEGGVIVERVIRNRIERFCYEGKLTLCKDLCALCAPLRLCEIEITDIQACCERLDFSAVCIVQDARGKRTSAHTSFSILRGGREEKACAGTIRRGAKAVICRQRICPDGTFHVCLEIDVRTVWSRSELICAEQIQKCPDTYLPLYPQISMLPNEHVFCGMSFCRE